VSVIARDLREARSDPEYSLETVLARARPRTTLRSSPSGGALSPCYGHILTRWLTAAATMAAVAVLVLACSRCGTLGPLRTYRPPAPLRTAL